MGTLQEDQFTFLFISCWILAEIRNVSDKILEKIKTNILCLNPPSPRKPYLLWVNVKRYGSVQAEATDDNVLRRMRVTCWITKATDTHTYTI